MNLARRAVAPLLLFCLTVGAAGAFGPGCGPGAETDEGAGPGFGGLGTGPKNRRPAAALSVTLATPQGKTSESAITVTFNAPLFDPALTATPPGEGAIDAARLFRISPEIYGRVEWLGPATVRLTPFNPLAPATTYTVTVLGEKSGGGLVAAEGGKLEADYTFSFTTPTVSWTWQDPADGDRSVATDVMPMFALSQPFEPDALARSLKVVRRPGADSDKPDGVEDVGFVIARPEGLEPWQRGYAPPAQFAQLQVQGGLKPDSRYEVTVAAGFKTTGATAGLDQPIVWRFRTYGPLRVAAPFVCDGCPPPQTLPVRFTTPVNCESPGDGDGGAVAAPRPAIEPPVSDLACAWSDGELVHFRGRFAPNTAYKVTFAAGSVVDRFKQPLADSSTFQFRTGDYRPEFKWQRPYGVIEAREQPTHAERVRNMGAITLRARALSQIEFVSALRVTGLLGGIDNAGAGDGDAPADPNGAKLATTLDVTQAGAFTSTETRDTPRSRQGFETVEWPLAPHLGGADGAALLLQLTANTTVNGVAATEQVYRLALVTDLGLTVKLGPRNGGVWVHRLSTAGPVEGAFVTLRSAAGAELAKLTTDTDGFAAVPEGVLGYGAKPPRVLVFAEKDRDLTFASSQWTDGIEPWQFGIDTSPWDWESGRARVFGYTDRGVYRPGQTVHAHAVIRAWTKDGLRPPTVGGRALYAIYRDDEVVAKGNGVLDAFGTSYHPFPLPPAAGLGLYTLALWSLPADLPVPETPDRWTAHATATFRVEEYKPAEFRVGAAISAPAYRNGDTLKWTADAAWLFGAPMAGKTVRARFVRDDTDFTPPGFEGFQFGPWVTGNGYGPVFHEIDVKLDAAGRSAQSLKLDLGTMERPARVTLTASVTDDSGQTLTDNATALVHPGDTYVGVRTESFMGLVGKQFNANVVAASPAGKALTGVALDVKFVREVWTSKAEAAPGGGLSWVNESREVPVGECRVVTAAKPRECRFTPSAPGSHRVRVATRTKNGRTVTTETTFYIVGADRNSDLWAKDNSDRVTLTADRHGYKVGDKAQVLIQSPWPEGAVAVVTVEREGVLSQFRTKVVGSAPVVTIPVTAAMAPNAFASVMLVRGRVKTGTTPAGADLGKPAFRIGYVALPVANPARALTVKVSPTQTDYRPGGKATVTIDVREGTGAAREAQLTVMAVDEGVLSLTRFATPDPRKAFDQAEPLRVETAQSRIHVIGQRHFGTKGDDEGGGGGLGGDGADRLRNNFAPVAFHKADVRTGPDGRAIVAFDVPDNLTEFRVMAIAVTEGDAYGQGAAAIRVNKPLMLRGALPRFVRPGDALAGGVVVNVQPQLAGAAGQVTLASFDETRFTLAGERTVTVAWPKGATGGSTPVRFALTVKPDAPEGPAKFAFNVTAAGEKDAVELTLPVVNRRTGGALQLAGWLTADGERALNLPAGAVVGEVSATLSRTPLFLAERELSALVEYPYGCLEQRLSKVIPLVAAVSLGDQLGLSGLDAKAARGLVESFVAALPGFACDSGGFDYYPGCRWGADPYLTAYALRFVALAREAGYLGKTTASPAGGPAAGPAWVGAAVQYLTRFVRGEGWDTAGALDATDQSVVGPTRQAAALAVLASFGSDAAAGGGASALEQRLFAARASLPVVAKAHLLTAIAHRAPASPDVKTLVAEIEKASVATPTGATVRELEGPWLSWLWITPRQAAATVLEALVRTRQAPQLAAQLAKGLVTEAAFGAGVAGSSETLHTHEAAQVLTALALWSPTVTAGAGATARLGGQPLALLDAASKAPVARGKLAQPGSTAVRLERKGAGDLYYALRATYDFPPGVTPPAESRGFTISRTVTALDGKPLAAALRAGDLVRVTVSVKAEREGRMVVIDDPLPAGLEAVNGAFATDDSVAADRAEATASDGGQWAWPLRELRDDRVVWTFRTLPAGSRTLTYAARVTSPGEYVAPAPRVAEMYDATRMGRGTQATFRVVP
jgi:alpha-2-macroglobulin